MAVIALMATVAFAGTLTVNTNGINNAFTISQETLGSNRGITLDTTQAAAATNGVLLYIPGQDLTTSVVVTLAFTGGAFNGGNVLVCNAGTNQHIATAAPAAGTASQSFIIGTAATAGSNVYFTSAANCGAAGNTLPVRINTTTATGFVTALITAAVGGITTDTAGSANVARIRTEYSATSPVLAAAHVVDYLGTPGNGTTFTVAATGATNLTALSAAAANINRTLNQFAATNGSAAVGPNNAALTVGSVVSLTDTQAWQGLSKVFLSGVAGGNCTDNAGGNIVGTGAPTGTIALTLPAASFNGSGNIDISLCLLGGGNALSIPRTIAASVDVGVTGTGANDPAASSFNSVDGWTTNAYQGFIGWLVNSSVIPTFCLVANNDTAKTATVLMDVVSSEGSVVLSSTLGTVAPKTAKLATFTSNSASFTGGTAVSLATLPADNRYSAKITATTAPANASVTCIQTDPATGVKRAVPVFSNSPNIY
jgi:hypothetical protein